MGRAHSGDPPARLRGGDPLVGQVLADGARVDPGQLGDGGGVQQPLGVQLGRPHPEDLAGAGVPLAGGDGPDVRPPGGGRPAASLLTVVSAGRAGGDAADPGQVVGLAHQRVGHQDRALDHLEVGIQRREGHVLGAGHGVAPNPVGPAGVGAAAAADRLLAVGEVDDERVAADGGHLVDQSGGRWSSELIKTLDPLATARFARATTTWCLAPQFVDQFRVEIPSHQRAV